MPKEWTNFELRKYAVEHGVSDRVNECITLLDSLFLHFSQSNCLFVWHAHKVTRGKIPINLCDKTNEQTCRREKNITSKMNQTKYKQMKSMIEPIRCDISAGVIYDSQKLKPKLNCEKPAQCISTWIHCCLHLSLVGSEIHIQPTEQKRKQSNNNNSDN